MSQGNYTHTHTPSPANAFMPLGSNVFDFGDYWKMFESISHVTTFLTCFYRVKPIKAE